MTPILRLSDSREAGLAERAQLSGRFVLQSQWDSIYNTKEGQMFLVYTGASWLASRCNVTDGLGEPGEVFGMLAKTRCRRVGLGACVVSAGGYGTIIVAFQGCGWYSKQGIPSLQAVFLFGG